MSETIANLTARFRRRRDWVADVWRDLLAELVDEPKDLRSREWAELRRTIHSTIWRLAISTAALMALWSLLR